MGHDQMTFISGLLRRGKTNRGSRFSLGPNRRNDYPVIAKKMRRLQREMMQARVIGAMIASFLCIAPASADEIAFFYALDADFQALKSEAVASRQPVKIGDRSIQVLTLAKHKIYAVKMGSGAVETAASAQAVLARFRCDRAFSLGPVGGLADELEIGKWYRVASIVPYQKGSWTSAGFQSTTLPASPGADLLAKVALPKLFEGVKSITVASGEIFVASSDYRQQLRQRAQADAVDMNLFGLLTVCAAHHLPVINWRIVSDKADDTAGEDFRKFTQTYDGAGGRALAELIRNLQPNPNSPESYPELDKLLRN
jgi:adenosylhomocysteine nucleosidase